MDTFCDELKIPKNHVQETDSPNRFILIANKLWLQNLKQRKKIYDFQPFAHEKDRNLWPELNESWTKVCVQIYKKLSNLKVMPLQEPPPPTTSGGTNNFEMPLSYSEMISYISNANFKHQWKAAYKTYQGAHIKFAKQSQITQTGAVNKSYDANLLPFDQVLRELIQKIFHCCVIQSNDRIKTQSDFVNNLYEEDESYPNIKSSLIAIETNSHISVFFLPLEIKQQQEISLYDCVTYTPALLNKSINKTLFILYQLLKLVKQMHQNFLLLGDITLRDIYLNDNLWLQVIPKLENNLIQMNNDEPKLKPSPSQPEEKFDLKFAYDLEQFTLKEYCEMWCNGQLSNFDYLTILNNFSGRKIGLPENHHIMPWVTDFHQRNGLNWRDLTKSKYRLNKGDAHLDLMFSQNHNEVNTLATTSINSRRTLEKIFGINSSGVGNLPPHHVSDFLSEITYYVYMARRTPQKVLRHHIRPIWVPAEYPASIQRLQMWTPDECIPEFYSDPQIFKSIHEDLPDLELPFWATCPEDFIAKHREALESQHVSERLHHWIDLNFGYKLSGKSAIKAKNVCLSIVDNHKNLTKRGIVQLFSHAHPMKKFTSKWFSKIPPKLTFTAAEHRKHYRTLARSTENLNETVPQSHSRRHPSPSPSRTKLRSSTTTTAARIFTNSNVQPELIERSLSNQSLSNTIFLPKDYNPVGLLVNFEHVESFFAKTFHTTKKETDLNEKFDQNDLLFDDLTESSFENRIFNESFGSTAVGSGNGTGTSNEMLQKKRNSKLILSQQNQFLRKNIQQILEEKQSEDLENIACVIIEFLLIHRTRILQSTTRKERLDSCKLLVNKYQNEIPKCLKNLLSRLLKINFSVSKNIIEPPPPLTAELILEPNFYSIPFPFDYYRLYNALKILQMFDKNLFLLKLFTYFECDGIKCKNFIELDKKRIILTRKLSECKVTAFVKQTFNLFEPIGFEQFNSIELILPFFINLLSTEEETAILAAWYLFDQVAASLGILETKKNLMNPILKLYESDQQNFWNDCSNESATIAASTTVVTTFRMSSTFKSRKIVKLYHHSFLLKLIVRFGLKCFLDNFIQPLIEAVAGFKEPIQSNGYHCHKTALKTYKNLGLPEGANRGGGDDIDSDNSLTLMSELTINNNNKKTVLTSENEEVFNFDAEDSPISAEGNMTINSEIQSVNSLEMQKAEEAIEDAISAEKLVIRDIFSPGSYSNNSFEDDKTSDDSKDSPQKIGPISPTIAIPNTYRRTYELSTIDCEIGSKKSFDSFDFGQETEIPKIYQADPTDENPKIMVFSEKIDSEVLSVNKHRISEMSMESLIWLSYRLGPILSARYLTKNLLRILTLCYAGQENLLPATYDDNLSINYFSIADAKVIGDEKAEKILQSLTSISALFGDQFILLQYLPYISELIALCKRRPITSSLEGALISSLQLVKYIIPCISDGTIMANLQDVFVRNILNPVLTIVGSTKSLYPTGFLARSVLIRKLLDTLYVICYRIGVEMSKECLPVLQEFFLIFDKAYEIKDNLDDGDAERSISLFSRKLFTENASEDGEFQSQQRAFEEIRDVFSPNLAHCSYVSFLKFFGEKIMQDICLNLQLILTLCHEHEQPNIERKETLTRKLSYDQNLGNDEEFASSHSFGTSAVTGNRIEIAISQKKNQIEQIEILDLVANKFEKVNSSRHLYGNWLAYWRWHIGRPDNDINFNLKQIKLQTFVGHTNTVRAILALDNENSFMSASKDKTVKLWSLRNEGDGKKNSSCQYTYSSHKKSVHSLAFLETNRLIASCDSGIHFWDPFIGRPLGVLDSHRHHSPVSVVKSFPTPSPLVIAGTQESTVKIIDCRTINYVNEWKVSILPNSTVRCLAIAPSGNWIAVGLSTGNIVLLDARTGILLRSWKATEGELLQVVALNDQQICSSSLDCSLVIWNVGENNLQQQLKQPQEPAICLHSNGSELIWATPANRIGIHANVNSSDSTVSVSKLRSETLKGVLTSLTVLPLNRMILSGNDNGNVVLFC